VTRFPATAFVTIRALSRTGRERRQRQIIKNEIWENKWDIRDKGEKKIRAK
jgi:hypothetical protein